MEDRINNMINMIESGDIKGFLDDIDKMAASKAYLVIRDNLQQKHIKAIRESSPDNYKLFQDIKIRAKQSWEYDHKSAIIEDINRACMNLYTIILKLMRVQNDDFIDELNKIKVAINKIEKKIGIDVTKWDDETERDDNTDVSNVQRVEENI